MSEPTAESMRRSLVRVAATLKDADVPFALGGSYASWARGGPEPDHDVDFLIRQADVDRALQVLDQAGLRTERPVEDWLVKVYDENCLIDLIHHPSGRPVTDDVLNRAEETWVASVLMPVLGATDLVISRLLPLCEHYCDFGRLLPMVRALREQVDWQRVRRETAHSPYAAAFLVLTERLGVVEPEPPTER